MASQWEEADPLTIFDVKRFNAVRGYQAPAKGREISRCLKELRQLRKEALQACTANPRRSGKGTRAPPPAVQRRRGRAGGHRRAGFAATVAKRT